MKRIFLTLLMLFMLAAGVQAQDGAPQVQPERFSSGDNFLVKVRPQSLNVHRLPAEESERVASLFKNDIVQLDFSRQTRQAQRDLEASRRAMDLKGEATTEAKPSAAAAPGNGEAALPHGAGREAGATP